MADKTELRMNLAAIKRVDPYAKDIVDSSAHVAFYTFNSDETEWEKTDVEGAFFVYSRNAEPYNSIFINNRLNTNSLVEPITTHIELQSQPPFLLYRNERSRIRGFWFYNQVECDRIGELVERLVKECGDKSGTTGGNSGVAVVSKSAQTASQPIDMLRHSGSNVDIFSMLSKAQQDFNNSLTTPSQLPVVVGPNGANGPAGSERQQVVAPPAGTIPIPIPVDGTSQSVMNFFAAAKPAKEVPYFHRMLSAPVHVDQIEKQQQGVLTPHHDKSSPPQLAGPPPQQTQPPPGQQQQQHRQQNQQPAVPTTYAKPIGGIENGFNIMRIRSPSHQQSELGTSPLATFINTSNLAASIANAGHSISGTGSGSDGPKKKLKQQAPTDVSEIESRHQPLQHFLKKPVTENSATNTTPGKPALMPPTMFKSTATTSLAGANNVGGPTIRNSSAAVNKKDAQPAGFKGQPKMAQSQKVVAVAVDQQKLQQPLISKPEPLTQTQLLQAMSYLIKNDPDFVRKLHEAYLKSFTEMVSL